MLKQKSDQQLREMFLPRYFHSLVTDDKNQHGWKATIFPNKIFLVMRFFSDVNEMSKVKKLPEKKLQAIFPAPSNRATFVQITNTASFLTF